MERLNNRWEKIESLLARIEDDPRCIMISNIIDLFQYHVDKARQEIEQKVSDLTSSIENLGENSDRMTYPNLSTRIIEISAQNDEIVRSIERLTKNAESSIEKLLKELQNMKTRRIREEPVSEAVVNLVERSRAEATIPTATVKLEALQKELDWAKFRASELETRWDYLIEDKNTLRDEDAAKANRIKKLEREISLLRELVDETRREASAVGFAIVKAEISEHVLMVKKACDILEKNVENSRDCAPSRE